MSDDAATAEQWRSLGDVLAGLAREDTEAPADLQRLTDPTEVDPEVARAAEHLGLLLVRLEGRDFLLSLADDAEARLRSMNELKDRHLGIAAHDLRSPIGSIRGLASLIARGKVSAAEEPSYVESIVRICDEMLTLLESLLDVAVIESGRLELDRTSGNLGQLVRERAERVAARAGEKDIEVLRAVKEVPDTTFDAVRMGQVVDNLLSNAVKFSPSGSVIEVACGRVESGIEITVRDEGPGIPDDDLPKLFDPYRRATVRPTGGEKSTGLGLSIAKPIVDAHGGSLEVRTAVGEGTTFTILLPL